MPHDRLTISTAIITTLSRTADLPVNQLIQHILDTPTLNNTKVSIFSNRTIEETKIRNVVVGLLSKKILKAVTNLDRLEICLNLSNSQRAKSFIRKVEQLNSL